jgi:hypothetical protein
MDDQVDYRLASLGRYLRGTPRERCHLWFGHPGLRACFDALDRHRLDPGFRAVPTGEGRWPRAGSNGGGPVARATAVGSGGRW